MSLPKVQTLNDYDGFFTAHVNYLIKEKHASGKSFNTRKVQVIAAPFLEFNVAWDASEEGVLKICFYSVLRMGMGNGSYKEADEEIMNLL